MAKNTNPSGADPNRPSSEVFELKPQRTIAKAIAAANQHVQNVHKAAQK